MPVPHTHEPSPKGPSKEDLDRGLGSPIPGAGRGTGWGRGGWHDPAYRGWDNPRGRGGRGWDGGRGGCGPGVAGPSTMPPFRGLGGGLGDGASYDKFPTRREQKRAWRAEKRGVKYERRRMKRARKHERRQRKREVRAMRHGEGHGHSRGAWKLIISSHGAHRETEQS